VKKGNGESLVLNPDETVDVIDADGKVKGKEDFRFKVSYDLRHSDSSHGKGVVATDSETQQSFHVIKNSRVERIGNKLYEVLPNKVKLLINADGSKTHSTKDTREVCYSNQKGYMFDKVNGYAYTCKCTENYTLDKWTCKKSKGLA